MKRKEATIRAILDYWIAHYRAEWPDWPQAVDLGEPSCWRCGWWADSNAGWHVEKHPHGLERSHLHDHARGGGGDPSNYVMLCRHCNRSMPMFTDRAAALAWVQAGARSSTTQVAGLIRTLVGAK